MHTVKLCLYPGYLYYQYWVLNDNHFRPNGKTEIYLPEWEEAIRSITAFGNKLIREEKLKTFK